MESILAGPRGRELCLRVAAQSVRDVLHRWELAERDAARLAELAEAIRSFDVAVLASCDGPTGSLLEPLADSVCSAMYWQAPFERERLLTDRQIHEALVPIAEALTHCDATRWWFEPVRRETQRVVTWGTEPARPPSAETLDRWWQSIVGPEPLDDTPPPPGAEPVPTRDPYLGEQISGIWLSTPGPSSLLATTRPLGPWDAVGLFLVEECQGDFPDAVVQSVEIDPDAKVYEIASPRDWVHLTRTYPLDVTHARRYDWFWVTGWEGPWLIPDWRAVAADWDGVHLTVAGYLAGATRMLSVDAAGTLIAGWGPDETYWLTDRARLVDDGRAWHFPDDADCATDWDRR